VNEKRESQKSSSKKSISSGNRGVIRRREPQPRKGNAFKKSAAYGGEETPEPKKLTLCLGEKSQIEKRRGKKIRNEGKGAC